MTARLDPFDTARARLQAGRRRRRDPARAPATIVPLQPPAAGEQLSPDRLDAARAALRARIPPRED